MEHVIYQVRRTQGSATALNNFIYTAGGEQLPAAHKESFSMPSPSTTVFIDRDGDENGELENAVNLSGARAFAWDPNMFEAIKQFDLPQLHTCPLHIKNPESEEVVEDYQLVYIANYLEVIDKDETELDEDEGIILSMEDVVLKSEFTDSKTGETVNPNTVHLARLAEFPGLCIASKEFAECVENAGLTGNTFTDPIDFCV